MKLGQLNAAIRDAERVNIYFNAGGRAPLLVAVQKTSLIAALAAAFPGGRAQETGLCIMANCLTGEPLDRERFAQLGFEARH